jgi:cell division protein FtsL
VSTRTATGILRPLRRARAARAARYEAPHGRRDAKRARLRALFVRVLFVAAVAGALATVVWRQTAGVDRQREVARLQTEVAVAEGERVELANRVQALQTRARVTRVAAARLGLQVARDDQIVLLPVPAAGAAAGGGAP